MKKNRHNLKEAIVNALKFITLTIVMIIGFWAIYAMIWIAAGLPETAKAMGVLFGLAMFTEFGFIEWLSN